MSAAVPRGDPPPGGVLGGVPWWGRSVCGREPVRAVRRAGRNWLLRQNIECGVSVTRMQPKVGGNEPAASYRRSTGSSRGLARRSEMLAIITDDVAEHGFVGFSLRRAAGVVGTTHKVLLYHFRDAEDLMAQVAVELRGRRIDKGVTAALEQAGPRLVDRVRALWPVLLGSEQDALLQAVGLAMYDPERYAALVQGSAAAYLEALRNICPAGWAERRKSEVAELVLATMRGLLVAQRTEDVAHDDAAGLAAMERALANEEANDIK